VELESWSLDGPNWIERDKTYGAKYKGMKAEMEKTGDTIRFSAPVSARIPLSGKVGGAKFVEGTVNGFPFRALIEDDQIVLSAAQQDAAGGKPGEDVPIELTRFDDEPEVRVPEDFMKAIQASEKAGPLWPEITPMARREWVRWIISGKLEETRRKRIEVGIDKMSKGMRRPCCFPGLNFVTKDLVPPEETWGQLPSSRGPASPRSEN
jgi:hypothetical protein